MRILGPGIFELRPPGLIAGPAKCIQYITEIKISEISGPDFLICKPHYKWYVNIIHDAAASLMIVMCNMQYCCDGAWISMPQQFSHWCNGCVELLLWSYIEAAPSLSPSQPARHRLKTHLTHDFHLHVVPQEAWYHNSSLSNSMHIQGREPAEARYHYIILEILEPVCGTESSCSSPFKWELAGFLLHRYVECIITNFYAWLQKWSKTGWFSILDQICGSFNVL